VVKWKKEKRNINHAMRDVQPNFQAILGAAQITRPDAVKKFHEYLRNHQLQNPTIKTQFISDDALKSVLGKQTFTNREVMGIVSKNALKPAAAKAK